VGSGTGVLLNGSSICRPAGPSAALAIHQLKREVAIKALNFLFYATFYGGFRLIPINKPTKGYFFILGCFRGLKSLLSIYCVF
jgi:hypothetical protein